LVVISTFGLSLSSFASLPCLFVTFAIGRGSLCHGKEKRDNQSRTEQRSKTEQRHLILERLVQKGSFFQKNFSTSKSVVSMPASTYDKVRLLAEGGFGVVHLVQRQKDAKVSRQLKQKVRVKHSIISVQYATWMQARKEAD
jgi:hypothetical protein